jgi:galactokinase
MTETFVKNLINAYKSRFQKLPTAIISAPGRINLIGEHTDYSGGYVLPVAIDLRVTIAFGPRDDQAVELISLDFEESFCFDLDEIDDHQEHWKSYLTAVAMAMQEDGYNLKGWRGVVSGNIPIGAGLSSSAAFEVTCILAFCHASHLSLPPEIIALLGQKAETKWVGVNVGIMDQLISAAGKACHGILLDCASLKYELIPIPNGISFLVLDTMTRRNLSGSDYNQRHNEVKSAINILGQNQLRAGSTDQLKMLHQKGSLSDDLYPRAKHVITENQRVLKFSQAMAQEDLTSMGALINQSHLSLKNDFEVSSPELNLIVEAAQSQPNCLGARMIGAGFGGCALALVESQNIGHFIDRVTHMFHEKSQHLPHIFQVASSDGGKIEQL